jgi:hypothetical protein
VYEPIRKQKEEEDKMKQEEALRLELEAIKRGKVQSMKDGKARAIEKRGGLTLNEYKEVKKKKL